MVSLMSLSLISEVGLVRMGDATLGPLLIKKP